MDTYAPILKRLFPITFAIDEDGWFSYCSEKAAALLFESAHHAHHAHKQMSPDSILEIKRPINTAFKDLKRLELFDSRLFLLETRDGRNALRAQLLILDTDSKRQYVFLCTPWIEWYNESQLTMPFDISHFPVIDAQFDLQVIIDTQRNTMSELDETARTLRDTDRMLLENVKLKEQMIAVLSHEIRTPLNSIIHSIHLLYDRLKPRVDDQAMELFRIMSSSADILLAEINQILDYSKLNNSQHSGRLEPVKLPDLLKEVSLPLERQFQDRMIELELDVDSVKGKHMADRGAVTKIAINLLTNAFKHTTKGTVSLSLKEQEADQGECNLVLTVKDSGRGMTPEQIEKIYEPFWNDSKDGSNSTGLGLYIVKRIVESLQGTIHCESIPGRGTTFIVVFQGSKKIPEVPSTPVKALAGGKELQGCELIVVDDNTFNLRIISMLLEGRGASVRTTSDGASLLSMLKEAPANMIVMDVQMPGIDGLEATRMLRQHYSAEALPILGLTAYDHDDITEQCLDSGMNDVTFKPIDKHILIKSIASLTTGNADLSAAAAKRDLQASL